MGTLLYDLDCGFCKRSAEVLRGWGVRCAIVAGTPAALTERGVDAERAQREIPYVADEGTVRWGAAAIAEALRTGPVVARAAGAVLRAPGARTLAAVVYRVVAQHRHRLPGGTATCRLPQPPPPAV